MYAAGLDYLRISEDPSWTGPGPFGPLDATAQAVDTARWRRGAVRARRRRAGPAPRDPCGGHRPLLGDQPAAGRAAVDRGHAARPASRPFPSPGGPRAPDRSRSSGSRPPRRWRDAGLTSVPDGLARRLRDRQRHPHARPGRRRSRRRSRSASARPTPPAHRSRCTSPGRLPGPHTTAPDQVLVAIGDDHGPLDAERRAAGMGGGRLDPVVAGRCRPRGAPGHRRIDDEAAP